MTFEFLWTDKCFLSLLILSALFIILSFRKQHIRLAMLKILHRPIAVGAGIILLFFIGIAVLDSIHFVSKKNENNYTILDNILSPIDKIMEKTYSSPLALKQFVTETTLINGVITQIYPSLIYPGEWVKNEQDKGRFIKKALYHALYCSMIAGLLLGLALILFRLFKKLNPYGILGSAGWSALITLAALTFLTVLAYDLSRTFHVLGTGQIGQDIFYFTVKSIRTGLVIGFLTTLFMMPLALFLGIVAGYFGGLADDLIQYVYTTLSSIPGVLLITASVLSLQIYISNHPQQFTTLAQSADARLLALCFILGVTSWTNLCRLLRAETLKLREVDYIQAARALGSNWFTIIRKHLLPNLMHIVVITLVLDFSFLIMAEALLSYVGVGVSPVTISWGNMINSARLELARNPVIWWPMMAAFVFMFVLVLAINLFADALRDALDPQQ